MSFETDLWHEAKSIDSMYSLLKEVGKEGIDRYKSIVLSEPKQPLTINDQCGSFEDEFTNVISTIVDSMNKLSHK